jgi:hypothetical protein
MSPDIVPQLHQPLTAQLEVAALELGQISSGLWAAVGYNQDPLEAAAAAFPAPNRRRSDTPFEASADEEAGLRQAAAELGPGREDTESVADLVGLGAYSVSTEAIEWGQEHKGVTEVWRALDGDPKAPLMAFASDRAIPKWSKGKENEVLDAERLSTVRLLTIGGAGLAGSADFFYRAGIFDAEAKLRKDDPEYQQGIRERALASPDTEYDAAEAFLRGAVDISTGERDEVLPIGYDPENGQLVFQKTGQVKALGTIAGRSVILVHKEARRDGTALDTADTMLLMGGISAAVTDSPDVVMSYWTSATYKPSRLMSGIRAGILAAQRDTKLRVVVPSYGYTDLSRIKGEQDPNPPSIGNIAGELGKAADEAKKLRAFIQGLRKPEQ